MSTSHQTSPASGNRGDHKSKSTSREYAEAIITAIILALIVRTFFVQAFKIPSGSMRPTLIVGDHILVNKMQYGIQVPFVNKPLIRFGNPEREDVVVFVYPVEPSKDFIKRIIGLPGDRIQIINKQVYINDRPYPDPHASHMDHSLSTGQRDNLGPISIPEGSYFVLGDNRDYSYDSRFWGYVEERSLLGKAFLIYGSWTFRPMEFHASRVFKRIY